MAEFALSEAERVHLIHLVVTYASITDHNEQAAFIDNIGLYEERRRFRTGIEPQLFATELVRKLRMLGTLPSTGQPALYNLLDYLQLDVLAGHPEAQPFVERLLQRSIVPVAPPKAESHSPLPLNNSAAPVQPEPAPPSATPDIPPPTLLKESEPPPVSPQITASAPVLPIIVEAAPSAPKETVDVEAPPPRRKVAASQTLKPRGDPWGRAIPFILLIGVLLVVGGWGRYWLEPKFAVQRIGLQFALALKDWDRGIELGEALLISGDTTIESHQRLAEAYYKRSDELLWGEEYQTSIADISRAIELIPANSEYYRLRGSAYYIAAYYAHPSGNVVRAIADYDFAIQLNPTNARYFAERGNLYYTVAFFKNPAGDYAKAIDDYSRAIQLQSNTADYYFERGKVYNGAALNNHPSGDFNKAIEDFSRAIQINPNDPRYYAQRGVAFGQPEQDFAQSIEDYNRAIELDPDNPDYYQQRGVIYNNAMINNHPVGDYTKAIEDHSHAIELNPNNGEYYYHRSVTYGNMGNTSNAEADLAKAVELGYELP